MPSLLSFTSLLGAAVLALRALRAPSIARVEPAREESAHYRSCEQPADAEGVVRVSFHAADRPTKIRLLSGTLFAVYLSAWTLGWSGGSLPDHLVVLDTALTMVVLVGVWRLRVVGPLVVLSGIHLHHVAALGIVGLPSSSVQWSILSLSTGFVLLLASLMASYWSQRSVARMRSSKLDESARGERFAKFT